MAFLSVNNGPDVGARYDLAAAEIIMGRNPECQIVIQVGAVSRQHAKIVRDGVNFLIEDLKSRNGTSINGDNIPKDSRHKLQHGDQIRVCDVEFTFHLDQAPIPKSVPLSGTSPMASSGIAVFVEDNAATTSSTIMAKVDVSSSSRSGVTLTSSPETRLAALLEITHSLGKALSLDEVLPQVLNSLFKIFVQADRGFIVMRTDGGALVPRWTKVRRSDNEDTIRISRTILNKVIESREAILSADASSDSQFAMSQSIADFRIRSMMCAPLIDSDGKAFGALQIDTLDQKSRFKNEDLELLISIASQAAISIDNAQLHENALKQKALQRDLELAHEVQKGFLPEGSPNLPGYACFQFYQPASHVGGDYFDYISLPDGRMVVLVADVVGHGVAAALMMARLSAEVRYFLVTEATPAAAVGKLNTRIAAISSDRFVTMIMLVLDPKLHEVTIVNAGHMAPIVRHADGTLEEPGEDISGPPLGIMDDTEYDQIKVVIAAGDLFVMYTDGINEAYSAANEEYGIDRIRNIVKKVTPTPKAVGQAIVDDVRRHLGGRQQDDDMCLVCIARTGP